MDLLVARVLHTKTTTSTEPPPLDGATLWRAIESAAEQAGFGVYVSHIDVQPPRLLYVNPRAAEIIGRSREDLIGRLPWIMLREQDHALVRAAIERPTGAPPMTLELEIERPDGKIVPIELAATRISADFGVLSFGYFRDVSNDREAMAALRRSEARFRFLVESAPDGVVILKRGLIAFMNPKAGRLLGVAPDEALGRPIASFLPPEDARRTGERIMAMLTKGVEFPPSEYNVLADRTRIVEIKSVVCEWEGSPAVIAFARDVTERKAIQRRLVESDRLAALGTLAAGVAHEINNPLTYAQLSAQHVSRLLERAGVADEMLSLLRGYLEDIDHGISRIASITQSLRSFVKDDAESPGPVDLEEVVRRALKMVDNDLRHAARLMTEIAPMPPALGNAARLEQVFINVLINAIKALPPDPVEPHEIHVVTEHTGDRVTVTIRDTGCGIPEALRGRIFEPFFTTRDVGHGMGLGLSVSKTIVEKLGGDIEVDSIENVGTTVRVHVPTYQAEVHATQGADGAPVVPALTPAAGPRRRVLVVDDERLICDAIERELADNHDVAVATTGTDALALVATKKFDLILCDVMMPGMDGHELYRRIAAQYPGVERRFVFMTGALAPNVAKALDGLPNPWLAKPFEIEDVLALIAASPDAG
ncbi:MAG TPA: PAS domain S-box protein [Kofleriaceae bacterium]|nr:PAS domain S-box protein [Kofleriaceae bacterium]